MRTRKTAIEWPEMNDTLNTVTTRTSDRPFKGKMMPGGESEKPSSQEHLNIKAIKGHYSSVRKNKLKGLCGNCDFADTCIYTKPAAGIWHCNEYQ